MQECTYTLVMKQLMGAGEFPAGADAGPAVANFGDLISTGGAWASMSIQFGLNYNWNIAGIIGVGSDNATPAEPIVITPNLALLMAYL